MPGSPGRFCVKKEKTLLLQGCFLRNISALADVRILIFKNQIIDIKIYWIHSIHLLLRYYMRSGCRMQGKLGEVFVNFMGGAAVKRIFLLGDSIRVGNGGDQGYEACLRALWAGRYQVCSPAENCQFAQYALRHLHEWAADCPAKEIELVIWNCGLWDVLRMYGDGPLTPPETYELMLRRLTRRIALLFPRAKQLFLTSTPTVEERYTGPSLRRNEDIRRYNRLARAVMDEAGIPVLDLYAAAEAFPLQWRADHVHYTREGSEALARCIAQAAERYL